MQTNESLQSKTIAFLRLPLIVGVVLIHSKLSDVVIGGVKYVDVDQYPFFSGFSYLFSSVFPAIAVPLFFFISGFLFFFKSDGFNRQTYFQKLKKRARTILIPYICWNLMILLLYLFADNFIPGLMSGRNKPVSEYTFTDWLWAFWNTQEINPQNENTFPINYPFWFIRDLMIVMLCSPVIYALIKRLKYYAVLFLGICWFGGFWLGWVGFSITAFFFFAAGAYFSIHQKDFTDLVKSKTMWLTIIYLTLSFIDLFSQNAAWHSYLQQANILVGMACAISLSAHFIEQGHWKTNEFLSESSFFLYAYHAMPLAFIIKLLCKTLYPQSELSLSILYIACPTLTILIGLGIYYLLKKYLPRITAVLTGGR